MTQPFRDTQTKRGENISLKCFTVNHLQAFFRRKRGHPCPRYGPQETCLQSYNKADWKSAIRLGELEACAPLM
jgi:hypothetical protein